MKFHYECGRIFKKWKIKVQWIEVAKYMKMENQGITLRIYVEPSGKGVSLTITQSQIQILIPSPHSL